jgi:hypothetical protein
MPLQFGTKENPKPLKTQTFHCGALGCRVGWVSGLQIPLDTTRKSKKRHPSTNIAMYLYIKRTPSNPRPGPTRGLAVEQGLERRGSDPTLSPTLTWSPHAPRPTTVMIIDPYRAILRFNLKHASLSREYVLCFQGS